MEKKFRDQLLAESGKKEEEIKSVNLEIEEREVSKNTLDRHRYQDKFTEETYRTESGIKVALPTYYRQRIWTDQEREALRIIKEEKQVKYYNKTPKIS